jgi:hypothetical protein
MVEYISKLKFHDLSKTLNLNKARDVLSELARVNIRIYLFYYF